MHRFFSPDPSPLAYTIDHCGSADFDLVKRYVAELELDDRAMLQEQFLVLKDAQGRLAGFGRVREYDSCSEMCSLGILPGQRSKRLGKELVKQMIKKARQQTYLVCIIPSYFKEFGFSICSSYPPEMQDKLDYCLDSLAVPEPYVVMVRG